MLTQDLCGSISLIKNPLWAKKRSNSKLTESGFNLLWHDVHFRGALKWNNLCIHFKSGKLVWERESSFKRIRNIDLRCLTCCSNFCIYSRFISAMWRSERELDYWSKVDEHYWSWIFQRESISEDKGKYYFSFYILLHTLHYFRLTAQVNSAIQL